MTVPTLVQGMDWSVDNTYAATILASKKLLLPLLLYYFDLMHLYVLSFSSLLI